ncbi:MAG: restriction endonuclease subunit S [Aliarcobacter skirrowii]|uniref:restriction endonuclease subunit S n=1 Tax=Aliarcobacter skirrowii TaxID=28200 RepID=UPI00242CBECA|nr:restriction endonuclease subunit S [Aliarcobacter skirrowii]MDD2509304.1 restriction endonuclease subunit S [Aliarcobacter skirrowii]MDD3497757.1 restriction endonuclease subunit S [Aliarcobacter skirrowii]
MAELYSLPDGWEWKKLGDLAKFQSGGTPSRSNKTYWDNGNIPWVKISDITDEMYVTNTEEFITKAGLDNSSAKLFPKNTILYTIFATIGKIGILDIEATTNQAISGIQPKNNVDLFYMYYGLKFITNEVQKVSTGVAQNNINLTKLKEQWFPLPPLEEQKRIVDKLDNLFAKIDKAIALHQKNIDEADIFMASVLNDVFAELEEKYEKKQLNEIVDNYDGKRIPIKSSDRENIKGIYPYYGASGIIDYVNDYIFDGEYLLISEDGANLTVRKYPIAFIAIGKFWVNNHAHIVSAKKDISTNKFMEYAFAFTDISSYITGSAQPKMSQGKMNLIEFSLPPLKTQQKVVAYLDEISNKMEKIKQIQKEKMQSLKALKASILDQAFKGEL